MYIRQQGYITCDIRKMPTAYFICTLKYQIANTA